MLEGGAHPLGPRATPAARHRGRGLRAPFQVVHGVQGGQAWKGAITHEAERLLTLTLNDGIF